jgi:hypothetical protein
LAGLGDYFMVRPDVRRCASPLCGGYWVSRVNNAQTRCANGRWARECYVAEIDWRGRVKIEARKALLRGGIIARRYPNFGNLGAFRVTESWQSSTETPANGIVFRVRDRGLRCITHPSPVSDAFGQQIKREFHEEHCGRRSRQCGGQWRADFRSRGRDD